MSSIYESTFEDIESQQLAVIGEDFLNTSFEFVNKFSLEDDVPKMQFGKTALNFEISSPADTWADREGYTAFFGQDLETVAKIESLVTKGQEIIQMVYSYRSASRAIPELSIDIPGDCTAEEKAALVGRRNDINRKVFDVMRQEMVKLKEFMGYALQAVNVFHGTISHLTYKELNKEYIPPGIYLSLVQLLDTLVVLDNLKDTKACLQLDFSRYKRVVGSSPSIEILDDLSQLQSFYSPPESRKARSFILVSLRDEVKRINGHEAVLLDALDFVQQQLEQVLYVLPEEKFRLLRVLPYLMLCIDGEADDARSFNVFKTNKIKLSSLQKLFRANPIVPLFGDMTVTLEVVLQRSLHYDRNGSMAALWGSELHRTSGDSRQVEAAYDLRTHWEAIRGSSTAYQARLAAALNRYKRYPFVKVLEDVSVEFAQEVFTLVTDGFRKLSKWTMLVKLMLSWKFTHPCSLDQLEAQKVPLDSPGVEYARVLRHNLRAEELSVLVDVVGLIKAVAAALEEAHALLAPLLRFHIHHVIQQFVLGDMKPLLHRVDKRNKPILPLLLKLRTLVADWGVEPPRQDYKDYTRKQGAVFATHPARVVSTAPSQLFILRSQVGALCDQGSELRKRTAFGRADLEKSDIELFQQFYVESFYFSYVLDFETTLRGVSDLSVLWLREHFLEMTKCVQFPIEMSLPWLLLEHLITRTVTNEPMLENVFYVLEVYNDAAFQSLHVVNQQHLYDEIEAEANLVMDQLYFLLSDLIYRYHRDLAASVVLDKSLKHKLEEVKGVGHLDIPVRHLSALLSQRHVQLLGRSVNFSFILTQNINNKFLKDLDFAVRRFEANSARHTPELLAYVDVLRGAHEGLSAFLELDPFTHMMNEVNESFSVTSFRGRISLHMLTSLARDLFPNCNYNLHTQRFVDSPIAIRPIEYAKPPKQSAVLQAYGQTFFKPFDVMGRLTRGFFGLPHVEAFLALGPSLSDIAMLIDQIVKNVFDKLTDVTAYIDALMEDIEPFALPPFHLGAVGVYSFFEAKLSPLLTYDDLKPEVFQTLREVGNALAFLKDLSSVLEVHDQFRFLLLAPLLGFTPPTVENVTIGEGKSSAALLVAAPQLSESPLLNVVNHMSQALANSNRLRGSTLTSSEVWARLPGQVRRLADNNCHFAGYTSSVSQVAGGWGNTASAGDTGVGRSLFKWVLRQVEEFVYQQNLNVDWVAQRDLLSSKGGQDGSGLKCTGFHRLWSALSFLFCLPDEADPRDEEDEESAEDSEDDLISNDAEFGHGFALTGCVLLHLLAQKPFLDLFDFSQFVLRVNAHEKLTVGKGVPTHTTVGAVVDTLLHRDVDRFVPVATEQVLLQQEIFVLLEALHQPRSSYIQTSDQTQFHPPPPTFKSK